MTVAQVVKYPNPGDREHCGDLLGSVARRNGGRNRVFHNHTDRNEVKIE